MCIYKKVYAFCQLKYYNIKPLNDHFIEITILILHNDRVQVPLYCPNHNIHHSLSEENHASTTKQAFTALRTCLELRYLSLCAAHSLGLELLFLCSFLFFLHFKSHLLFRVIYPDHLSKNLVIEYFFLSVKIRERNQDSSNNLKQLNTWPNTWNDFRHWTSGSQCN